MVKNVDLSDFHSDLPVTCLSGVRKYSAAVYDKCCDSFNALPIAALLDRRFLCVHGGISPELHNIADINKVRTLRA